MLRFPFGPRPAPAQPRNRYTAPPEPTYNYGDLAKQASFSPELSFLLSMTLKDGQSRESVLDMLKSIEPFVSDDDRKAIQSIFCTLRLTEHYRRQPPVEPPKRSGTGLSSFSRLSRQQALLDVLQRYASKDTAAMMHGLSQSARMQENFGRMIRRFEKLRQMDVSSPEYMFEAMSLFMPPDEQKKYRNMQNMMRMMGSMKNFKPEDLFKFMGSFK